MKKRTRARELALQALYQLDIQGDAFAEEVGDYVRDEEHDAETAAVRDYFQVENDAGERFWIYRSGDGEDGATGSQRWFLHGIFG